MPQRASTSFPAPDFEAALACAPEARKVFVTLPPSHRREYLVWIDEAKKPETRSKRIAGMIDKLNQTGGA